MLGSANTVDAINYDGEVGEVVRSTGENFNKLKSNIISLGV